MNQKEIDKAWEIYKKALHPRFPKKDDISRFRNYCIDGLPDALDEIEHRRERLDLAAEVIEAGKYLILQLRLRCGHQGGFDDPYNKADRAWQQALKKWEGEDSKISEKGKMELANAGYAEAKKDRETKARHWQECKNKPVGG